MRMIDADELWERLKNQREENKENGLPLQYNAGINQAIGIMNKLADTQYLYGMRLRGYAPWCQPMSGLVERRDSKKYHDELVYNRKLTDSELKEYELDFIGTL